MITCLHCKREFALKPKGPVLLGQSDEQKLAAAVQTLGEHIQKAHPAEWQGIAMMSAEMVAFMMLCQFDFVGQLTPDLKAKRDASAALLNRATRRVLTDEDIEKQVQKLITETICHFDPAKVPDLVYLHAPADHARESIALLLRQMRDFLYYVDRP
jgi:hypothetical protein